MKKILLVCSAGMSTSMIVKKMQSSAVDKNIEVTIWAISATQATEEWKRADILLLGPQVRFMINDMKSMVQSSIPVAIIDMKDYGTLNGEQILSNALDLIDTFQTQ